MMQDTPKDIAAIEDYHAHIYYDPATKDRAALLRQWVEQRFPGQMRMGSWHDQPVGPHVQAMYQIAFPPDLLQIESVVRAAIKDIGYEQEGFHWNTCDIEILLHPQSGRPRDDHTLNAVWMGEVLPVKTEVLREVG